MVPQEEEEISLVDIAKIPSQVHTQIAPSHMMGINAPFVSRDGKCQYDTPLAKAIMDDDFEAFVQLLDLYEDLPDQTAPINALNSLMQYDRPAMLDEYIRRTGQGIVLKKTEQKTDDTTTSKNQDDDADADGPRVYLGLNVHGKKRKDLVAKGDGSNHRQLYPNLNELPLLWQAAQAGAVGIVRYLASDQPLAAYKYYAASHGDARARMLRRIPDLAAELPEKLGWSPSRLNETVVTACIVNGGRLDVLEALVTIRPKEIDTAIHLK